MLGDLSDLRESLYAARLLVEHASSTPLSPADRVRWRARILSSSGDTLATGGGAERGRVLAQAVCDHPLPSNLGVGRLLEAARTSFGPRQEARDVGTRPGTPDGDPDGDPDAGASSGTHPDGWTGAATPLLRPRTGPGSPFLGRAAPPPARVPSLLDEVADTVASPLAAETWPHPVRAALFGFLMGLVQPWEGLDGSGTALLAETWGMAAAGFPPDEVPVAPAGDPPPAPPAEIADAHVRHRIHALVESCSRSLDWAREWSARSVLRDWIASGASPFNRRQAALVLWMAGRGTHETTGFREYVTRHAGRRPPSMRTLQRDWKGLVESGFLAPREDSFALELSPLCGGPGAPVRE